MMTEQDYLIISALIADGKKAGMTSYVISNETKISQPQVAFRLSKLIENSVVIEVWEEFFMNKLDEKRLLDWSVMNA